MQTGAFGTPKNATARVQDWHPRGQQHYRRGQDSNLRTRGYPVTDLANRRFRPLSHLSRIRRQHVSDEGRLPKILWIPPGAARYLYPQKADARTYSVIRDLATA